MSKLIIGLFVITLALTGCAGVENGNGDLSVAIPTDPEGFHPHQAVAAASAEIAFNIYEGLVKAAPNGDIIPALATEWEISPDGLIYTFTLRENVMFHNGQQLTPEDVVYSLSRMADPNISARATEFSVIESVEEQAGKVVITLNKPDAILLAQLTEFSASIFPREADQDLSTQPVGTGPFELTDWQPNNQLTLTAFQDYWQPELPKMDEVILHVIPEPTSAVNSLITGQVDLIPRLEPDYLHQVEDQEGLTIIDSPMNLVQLLAINNSVAPFDDIRVRQALNYAIDRDEIIQGAAWGKATPIGSNLSPAMDTWYHDLTDYYPHDPQKAKDLLEQAGYAQGFSATLHLPAPYPLHRNAGEIIADQVAQVGIDLDIQVIDWGTWLEQINTNREYQLTVVGFTGRLDPHATLNRYQSQSSRNLSLFSSSQYDDLLEQGQTETDQHQRQQIYKQLQTILAEEASNVYIMDPSQLVVMAEDVEGWSNYPVYVLDLAHLSR